jgi:hypothetical protein
MASADSPPPEEPTPPPLVTLATVALLIGASGMAVSLPLLASRDHLDVIAGAVGLLAGVVLVAVGILSLGVLSRSPATSRTATRVVGCLAAFLPSTVAALGWPILYFGAGMAVVLMPFVLGGCIVWAWVLSRQVADHLSELAVWPKRRFVRAVVFAGQSLSVVATGPLFGYVLGLLESMGYKIGWS